MESDGVLLVSVRIAILEILFFHKKKMLWFLLVWMFFLRYNVRVGDEQCQVRKKTDERKQEQ